MIAAILTTLPDCYTMHQLADIGQLRGHEMIVVNYRDCVGNSFGHERRSDPFVDSFERFEAVFSFLELSDLKSGLSVMRECEAGGAYSPNTSQAVTRCCDRLWLAQTLGQAAIPVPHAVIAHSTDSASDLLDSVGEGPWVLKLLANSTSFDRMIVARTREAALLAIEHFVQSNRDFLVQQYIAESHQEDIRVLVVDGRAIAAVLRRAVGDEVLPTWNAKATPRDLNVAERQLAERAATSLDLSIADVTLLRSNSDRYVLDVNPFPQLQWWDEYETESTANKLFDLIELRRESC